MPAKRDLTMLQLRYLLRLHHDRVSAREIGRLLGVARSTIGDNLKRAAAAGLEWPLAEAATDDVLELRMFGRAGIAPGQRRRVEPDGVVLARALKRPGVSLTVLWEEYRQAHSGCYGSSRFCDLLRGFERRQPQRPVRTDRMRCAAIITRRGWEVFAMAARPHQSGPSY